MASPVVVIGSGVSQKDSHQSQILSGTAPLLVDNCKEKDGIRRFAC
jgi:hypothetical protein